MIDFVFTVGLNFNLDTLSLLSPGSAELTSALGILSSMAIGAVVVMGMIHADHDSDFDPTFDPHDDLNRQLQDASSAAEPDDEFELPPISKEEIQSKANQRHEVSKPFLNAPVAAQSGARNTVQDPIWVEIQRQIVEERQRNSELRDLFELEQRERGRLAEQLDQLAEEKRVLLINLGEQKALLQDALEKNAGLKEKLTKASYAAIDAQQLQHDLDEQREQLTAEITRLRAALDAANKKEKILISESARTASLEHALAVLGDELESMAAELSTAHAELEAFRTSQPSSSDTSDQLKAENETLRQKLAERDAELEQLRAEQPTAHSTNTPDWQEERSQLTAQLDAARAAQEQLVTEKANLIGRIEDLEEKLVSSSLDGAGKQELKQARQTIDALQTDWKAAREQAAKAEDALAETARLRKQLEDEYEKRSRLVKKLAAVKKSRDGLRKDVRRSSVYQMELERQIETLKLETDALREKVTADKTPALQVQVTQLERELDHVRSELKLVTDENERLRAAHAEWVQRYEAQAAELQQRDESLMQLARRLEEKEKLGRQMRDMILAQKEAIEASHQDMKQLAAKYRKAMSNLSDLRGANVYEQKTADVSAQAPDTNGNQTNSGSTERFRG